MIKMSCANQLHEDLINETHVSKTSVLTFVLILAAKSCYESLEYDDQKRSANVIIQMVVSLDP